MASSVLAGTFIMLGLFSLGSDIKRAATVIAQAIDRSHR